MHSFKGKLPNCFTFFTERSSGGFYMDGNGGMPDLAGDYLLFLTRFPRNTDPLVASKAFCEAFAVLSHR